MGWGGSVHYTWCAGAFQLAFDLNSDVCRLIRTLMCVYWKYSAVFEHGHISLCCRKLWTPSVKIRYTSVGPAEGSLVIEDSKFLRVVGTNNRAGSTKSCCHKTTCMGNNPKPLTRSLRCTCIYIAARRLDYCTQEAVPSRRMRFT